jgi:hypothetical protein
MIVSIMQPTYLPWLGYFERMALSDLHIILDDVQIEHGGKTSFTSRNKIRTEKDWMWLTVPIKTSGQGQPLINEVTVDCSRNWRDKHWRSISQQYGRAPFFRDYRDELQEFYLQDWPTLMPLLDRLTQWLRERLGLDTRCTRSSELNVSSKKSELVLDLCKNVGATKYISGVFGRDYLDIASFSKAGIEVIFHDYQHPEYKQQFEGFEPYMSVIDLLFNHGPASLGTLITSRKI